MGTMLQNMLKCILLSCILTVILLLSLSFLLLKFDLSESFVGVGITCVYVISLMVGGFWAGKLFCHRKFFWGFLLGVLYFILLTFISFGVNKAFVNDATHFVSVLFMCGLSGMLGGMLSPKSHEPH